MNKVGNSPHAMNAIEHAIYAHPVVVVPAPAD